MTLLAWKDDAAAQRVRKQFTASRRRGSACFPVALRYCWPSELDLMATQAGFRLAERYADWERRPFGSGSTSHVSVYRPA